SNDTADLGVNQVADYQQHFPHAVTVSALIITAHQCLPSVLPSSCTHQCPTVAPSGTTIQCTIQCCQLVPPVSATHQCRLSVPIIAAYQYLLINAYQCCLIGATSSVQPISAHQCCVSVQPHQRTSV
ncbi:unnamed protein product, partial [Staurois parvus]